MSPFGGTTPSPAGPGGAHPHPPSSPGSGPETGESMCGINTSILRGFRTKAWWARTAEWGPEQLLGWTKQLLGWTKKLLVGSKKLVGGNEQLISGDKPLIWGEGGMANYDEGLCICDSLIRLKSRETLLWPILNVNYSALFVSIICECCYREVLESNLTTSEDGSTSSLILRPNRDEDGGQYLCQVSGGVHCELSVTFKKYINFARLQYLNVRYNLK